MGSFVKVGDVTHPDVAPGLQLQRAVALPSVDDVARAVPADSALLRQVVRSRTAVEDILAGADPRLLVVVGPCSIHDVDAAREYAEWLAREAVSLSDALFVVMRVYVEKPRTCLGWQGLLLDPDLDGTGDTVEGLVTARRLLCDINRLGLPTATEFVDGIAPLYLAELVTWAAVGARTAESPAHRHLASALACPVGFKNSTAGDVQVAVNAAVAASRPQRFLGVAPDGRASVLSTTGNPACHVILRGGTAGSNHSAADITDAVTRLRQASLPPRLMIDCGHGNAAGDFRRQEAVARQVAEHIGDGRGDVMGVMIESALVEGRQSVEREGPLVYGQSITDGCLGLEATHRSLHALARGVRAAR